MTALARPLLARFRLFLGEASQLKNVLNRGRLFSAAEQLTECTTKAEQQVTNAIRDIEKAGPKEVQVVLQTALAELQQLDQVHLCEAARGAAQADEFTTEERQITVNEALQTLARRQRFDVDHR